MPRITHKYYFWQLMVLCAVANFFYEKAHFVKADVAAAVTKCTGFAFRHASIRTLGKLTLSLVARCTMRSVLSDYYRRCNLPSGLSFRVDQVRVAQSPLEIRSDQASRGRRHFRVAALTLLGEFHLPSL